MGSLCCLEPRLSLLLSSLLRASLLLSATVYLSLLTSGTLVSTITMDQRPLLDTSTFNVLLLIFSTLFLTEIIFVAAVCQQSRPWLVPWLVINFLLVVFLLGAVLYNMMVTILPVDLLVFEDHSIQHQIQTWINAVNLLVIGQIVNFSAAFKLFMDMRFKRRVSFSRKVMEKNVSRIDMEDYESKNAFIDFVSLPVNDKSLKFSEDLEKSKERKRELRISVGSKCSDNEDSVMFSFDDEDNFA